MRGLLKVDPMRSFLLSLVLLFLTLTAYAQEFYTRDSSCLFYIPNTLSPNCASSDCSFKVTFACKTKKDYFFVSSDASMQIYNRWGQVVHEIMFDKQQAGWNGGNLDGGTYYWIFKFFEDTDEGRKERSVTGYLTLVRE
jgi:hypothetical protein